MSENGSTLTIYNVEASDQGTVTCRANNGYGTSPAASANLVVQCKYCLSALICGKGICEKVLQRSNFFSVPALVKGMPSIRYAGQGLQTVLVCPAVAEPRVTTVTWRKNNQVLVLGAVSV